MRVLKLKLAEFVTAPNACHFARVRFTEQRSHYLHTHDFSEVFWVENGQGWHGINGQRRALRAGMVVFVRAEDRHDFSCDAGGGVELANLAFAGRAWDRLRRRYFRGRPLAWDHRSVEAREISLAPKGFRQLRAAGEALSAGARDLAALDRFLLNLLHLVEPLPLVAAAAGFSRGPEVPVPSWLRRACALVRQPGGLEEGVPALVRHAARSAAHVSRQFQKHLGCTPTQWINQARMSYAAEQLGGSEAKILDIIADCGIQNPRHFYALFFARFGLTPRLFRLREQRVLKPSG